MVVLWEDSWGCSRALNTVAPIIKYTTTTRKIVETVFHFITLIAESLSSREESTVGLVENDNLGLEFWVADLGSSKSGAATGKTKRES